MGIDDDADLDLRPMEPPAPKARQARLPIDAPRPKFGQPIDSPRTRKRSTAGVASTPADEDKVGDYRHSDASRTNIPEAGLATQDRTPTDRVTYAYDPHLDPQLVWAGKAEHTSFDVDTVSLHIHERASTAAILRAVRREDVQRTLFSDPVMSVDQELAFYQHEMRGSKLRYGRFGCRRRLCTAEWYKAPVCTTRGDPQVDMVQFVEAKPINICHRVGVARR